MICSRLILDGELAFFKGARGKQGKAVHDACRADTGGDWYARDCAVTYQRQRLGGWELVTDYELKAKHEQRSKEEMFAEMYNEKQGGEGDNDERHYGTAIRFVGEPTESIEVPHDRDGSE